MTFACFQVCEYVPALKMCVMVYASQQIALGPRWVSISGYIPSMPAALPFFMFFRASFNSFGVTVVERNIPSFGQEFKILWYSFLIFFSNLKLVCLPCCVISLTFLSSSIGDDVLSLFEESLDQFFLNYCFPCLRESCRFLLSNTSIHLSILQYVQRVSPRFL